MFKACIHHQLLTSNESSRQRNVWMKNEAFLTCVTLTISSLDFFLRRFGKTLRNGIWELPKLSPILQAVLVSEN